MTYAQYINTLLASYKIKESAVKERLKKGFDDSGEILLYMLEAHDAERAKIEYTQFFSRCIRLNLDLDGEI